MKRTEVKTSFLKSVFLFIECATIYRNIIGKVTEMLFENKRLVQFAVA